MRTLESRLAEKRLPVVGQHGNFVPDNVFLGDRRVDVLDFACYREGLPLEDVAEMLLHLRAPELRKAFLDGYGGTIDDDALHLFTLTKALRMLARGGAEGSLRKRLRRIVFRALT